jgi:hypothetical protein
MATGGEHGKSERTGGGNRPMTVRRMAARTTPEWADGLKQLYDSVVEETLPDQFLDLLEQLDHQDTSPPGRSDAR